MLHGPKVITLNCQSPWPIATAEVEEADPVGPCDVIKVIKDAGQRVGVFEGDIFEGDFVEAVLVYAEDWSYPLTAGVIHDAHLRHLLSLLLSCLVSGRQQRRRQMGRASLVLMSCCTKLVCVQSSSIKDVREYLHQLLQLAPLVGL